MDALTIDGRQVFVRTRYSAQKAARPVVAVAVMGVAEDWAAYMQACVTIDSGENPTEYEVRDVMQNGFKLSEREALAWFWAIQDELQGRYYRR